MRVLLLGATGTLGSRILSALIKRGHTVSVFIRNPSKLAPGVQDEIFSIECGDATKSSEIKEAALRTKCDAIVNSAGLASVSPWGRSSLPEIVDAVLSAAQEIGRERGSPLRVWLLAGMGILDIPTQKYMLVDYIHVFPEHILTWEKVQAVPREFVAWSVLGAGIMKPSSAITYPVPEASSVENLLISARVPPEYSLRFLGVPLIGGYLNLLSQVLNYGPTTLEDNADLIAYDLLEGMDSPWIFQKVGVKERKK
ncbi:uncharacterized protein N7511_007325 [Penicillium nucicola]|uniref:uncharacterized protein n=1 Tax=Penicillium nucicola TaxID=1850975 RepID=UPI002545A238|nr:uncharacterized protein N7511_007325 [Penicillium nucicola]KAJ5757143.1 hypothetical protein N7511_007325 [Penicillium nucicola]